MASTALNPITNFIVKEFDMRFLSLSLFECCHSDRIEGRIVAKGQKRIFKSLHKLGFCVRPKYQRHKYNLPFDFAFVQRERHIHRNRIHKLHKDWSILIGILDGWVHLPNAYEISGLFDISSEYFPGVKNSFILNRRLRTVQQTLRHQSQEQDKRLFACTTNQTSEYFRLY